jgi:isoquinoline 1-oxidoreductase beta subunit
MNDYMVEAAYLAKQIDAPVKLTWSREDDFGHDAFRPGGFHSLKAGLDAKGKLVAYRQHIVTYGVGDKYASSASLGGNESPAGHVPNLGYYSSTMPLNLRTGPMRAPGSNALAFVGQSFLDEIAHAAGRDPLDFQLEVRNYIATTPTVSTATPSPASSEPTVRTAATAPGEDRLTNVLTKVGEFSNWKSRKKAPGHGFGIACYASHQGFFAEVAEVSVDAQNKITVHHVWVVGDIGSTIVNPGAAENMVYGSVLEGMSHMNIEVTLDAGKIVPDNFNKYQFMRLRQTPKIDVLFLKTDHPPTGLGEPALPPVLPAIANAVFDATGKRIRTLPLARSGFTFA